MSNRQILFNAADTAMRRLSDKDADVRTIAMQLRQTGRLVLKELRQQQPSPKMKLIARPS